jgi:hypothetical protein
MGIARNTFRQTMYVRRLTGTNGRGDQTHGEAEPHPCRSEAFNRMVRTTDGSMVVAGTRIFTEAQVGMSDLVFPPGADPEDYTASLRPLKVDDAVGLDSGAVDHYEVYV